MHLRTSQYNEIQYNAITEFVRVLDISVINPSREKFHCSQVSVTDRKIIHYLLFGLRGALTSIVIYQKVTKTPESTANVLLLACL